VTIGGVPAASPRYATDPLLVAFGAALRRARTQKQLSQEELAHRAGLDRSYVSSIERGNQNPGLIAVGRLAAALKVPIAALMLDAEI